jgi:hypothetical protein
MKRKASYKHATVRDLREAADIKMREAEQLRAEAEAMRKACEEALRRAKGNRQALLYDVRDELYPGGDEAAT